MKVLVALLCLAVAASARMAYRFSDGYLDILGAEPVQNFDCVGRSYGYYADVSTDCRVFHVCLPITDEAGELAETAHFSFFCPNQTVFSQESLTCVHTEDSFPCTESETLYELVNAEFGRIPEGVIGGGSSNVVFPGPSARSQPSPAVEAAAVEAESVDVAAVEVEAAAAGVQEVRSRVGSGRAIASAVTPGATKPAPVPQVSPKTLNKATEDTASAEPASSHSDDEATEKTADVTTTETTDVTTEKDGSAPEKETTTTKVENKEDSDDLSSVAPVASLATIPGNVRVRTSSSSSSSTTTTTTTTTEAPKEATTEADSEASSATTEAEETAEETEATTPKA